MSNWASFALKSHVEQHLPSCLSGPVVCTAESLPGILLLFIHTNLFYLSYLFDLYLTRQEQILINSGGQAWRGKRSVINTKQKFESKDNDLLLFLLTWSYALERVGAAPPGGQSLC